MYYFHPRIRPISSVFSPICEQVQVYEPCHAELSQIGNSLSQTQYRCQTLIARLFVLFVWVIFCLKKFSVHNNSDILLWTNKEYVYVQPPWSFMGSYIDKFSRNTFSVVIVMHCFFLNRVFSLQTQIPTQSNLLRRRYFAVTTANSRN